MLQNLPISQFSRRCDGTFGLEINNGPEWTQKIISNQTMVFKGYSRYCKCQFQTLVIPCHRASHTEHLRSCDFTEVHSGVDQTSALFRLFRFIHTSLVFC